jgi:parvulin-like peptidyl-prolyl isomerase
MRRLKTRTYFWVVLATACIWTSYTSAEVINGITAIVNDSVITYEEVQADVARTIELLQRQYARQPELLRQKVREAQEESIEELVQRKLILHEFKTAKYNLPESIIDQSIKDRLKRQFGNDRLTLTKTLQAQNITFETYRQQIREQIIVSIMRRRNIASEIFISPYKIESYYATNQAQFQLEDQIKLRMIVLDKTRRSSDMKKLGQEILLKLDEGVPFSEMAMVYSDGSQATQGGDWGWVERSVLVEDLRDTAFSLKPGQRSGLIEKPTACYIMLVEEVRPTHVKPISEVRAEIEKTLIAQESARLQKKWIERLKAKSFVRYFP